MTLIQQRIEYCEHWNNIEHTGYMQLEDNYIVLFYVCSICKKVFEQIEYMENKK